MAGQTRSLSINFGIVLPPEPMLWDGNLATDKSLKSCNGAAMNEDKPVVFVVDDDPSVRERPPGRCPRDIALSSRRNERRRKCRDGARGRVERQLLR